MDIETPEAARLWSPTSKFGSVDRLKEYAIELAVLFKKSAGSPLCPHIAELLEAAIPDRWAAHADDVNATKKLIGRGSTKKWHFIRTLIPVVENCKIKVVNPRKNSSRPTESSRRK